MICRNNAWWAVRFAHLWHFRSLQWQCVLKFAALIYSVCVLPSNNDLSVAHFYLYVSSFDSYTWPFITYHPRGIQVCLFLQHTYSEHRWIMDRLFLCVVSTPDDTFGIHYRFDSRRDEMKSHCLHTLTFTSWSLRKCLPSQCFFINPQEWKSLGGNTQLYCGRVRHSH
jgi:hypothetical protein